MYAASGLAALPPLARRAASRLRRAQRRALHAATTTRQQQLVVLYDGVCRLCSGVVSTLVGLDADGSRFRYCAAQSRSGRALLREHGISEADSLSSVVVIDPATGAHHRKSDAALLLAARAGAPYAALSAAAALVPRPLRDAVYDAVAANRYRWFGRLDACPVPPRGLASRFVDAGEEGGPRSSSDEGALPAPTGDPPLR